MTGKARSRLPGPGFLIPMPQAAPVTAVLDTHVILEVLHWRDPRSMPLLEACRSGLCRLVRSRETLAELTDVVKRPQLRMARSEACRIIIEWRRAAGHTEAARQSAAVCRDSGDQKFLDLAASAGAQLLVTRDRLLLRCRRRALRDGFAIVVPEDAAAILETAANTCRQGKNQ